MGYIHLKKIVGLLTFVLLMAGMSGRAEAYPCGKKTVKKPLQGELLKSESGIWKISDQINFNMYKVPLESPEWIVICPSVTASSDASTVSIPNSEILHIHNTTGLPLILKGWTFEFDNIADQVAVTVSGQDANSPVIFDNVTIRGKNGGGVSKALKVVGVGHGLQFVTLQGDRSPSSLGIDGLDADQMTIAYSTLRNFARGIDVARTPKITTQTLNDGSTGTIQLQTIAATKVLWDYMSNASLIHGRVGVHVGGRDHYMQGLTVEGYDNAVSLIGRGHSLDQSTLSGYPAMPETLPSGLSEQAMIALREQHPGRSGLYMRGDGHVIKESTLTGFATQSGDGAAIVMDGANLSATNNQVSKSDQGIVGQAYSEILKFSDNNFEATKNPYVFHNMPGNLKDAVVAKACVEEGKFTKCEDDSLSVQAILSIVDGEYCDSATYNAELFYSYENDKSQELEAAQEGENGCYSEVTGSDYKYYPLASTAEEDGEHVQDIVSLPAGTCLIRCDITLDVSASVKVQLSMPNGVYTISNGDAHGDSGFTVVDALGFVGPAVPQSAELMTPPTGLGEDSGSDSLSGVSLGGEEQIDAAGGGSEILVVGAGADMMDDQTDSIGSSPGASEPVSNSPLPPEEAAAPVSPEASEDDQVSSNNFSGENIVIAGDGGGESPGGFSSGMGSGCSLIIQD